MASKKYNFEEYDHFLERISLDSRESTLSILMETQKIVDRNTFLSSSLLLRRTISLVDIFCDVSISLDEILYDDIL